MSNKEEFIKSVMQVAGIGRKKAENLWEMGLRGPERQLLSKSYAAEELCDVGRDVHEAFDERFTPQAAGIPKDEHGFDVGIFHVSITWSPASGT